MCIYYQFRNWHPSSVGRVYWSRYVRSRNSMPPSRRQAVHKCYLRDRPSPLLPTNDSKYIYKVPSSPQLHHFIKPTTTNLSTWSTKVRSKTTQRPKISSYQELPPYRTAFSLYLLPIFYFLLNTFGPGSLPNLLLTDLSEWAILTVFYIYVTI